MKKTIGFTLIEILVTSAIIALLAGVGLAAYLDFNDRQILDTTANELKNNLRQARGWAMAGRKMGNCTGDLIGYQVSFLSGFQYQVKALCPNEVLVNTFSYSNKVTINPSSSSFLFQALTGETDQIQTININLSLGSRTKQLTIGTNGEIN